MAHGHGDAPAHVVVEHANHAGHYANHASHAATVCRAIFPMNVLLVRDYHRQTDRPMRVRRRPHHVDLQIL